MAPADAGAEGETGGRSGCWKMSDEKAESVLLCQCTIQDPTPDAFLVRLSPPSVSAEFVHQLHYFHDGPGPMFHKCLIHFGLIR